MKQACYHYTTGPQEQDLAIIWLSQELRQASGNGHVFELLNVWERYLEMANTIPVEVAPSYRSRLSTFKEALIPLVDEVYDFIVLRNAAPNERQTLLVPKECSHVLVSKLIDTEDTDEMTIPIFRREDDEFCAMVHVALKLRSDVLSHPAFTGVNVNQEAEIASVPNSVHMFLNLLLGDQSHFDECDEFGANELDGIRKERVLSIGQDIVYGVCENKNIPPKQVGLGLTSHNVTLSRKLVNLFYTAGHIASYGCILSTDIGMAESTLKSIDKDTGAVVPPSLVPGRFVHFSADNIDINHSSLGGKNTFHATQMAVWQTVLKKDTECSPRVKLEKSLCLIIDGQATVMALGKPDNAITFGDYADQFVGHALKTANDFDRVDVVFDRYQEFSIKTGTRVKQTKKLCPIRRLIENKDDPLPKQWPDYMASEENKAELSAFLSEYLISDGICGCGWVRRTNNA